MKRAVLMARVSTTEQAEKGYSLPSQLEACKRYAVKHGFQVVDEITDDCSGAIPVAERPGGAKVYAMLRSGQVDVVVQYTIDRTSRDKREYPIEFLVFLRDVQDLGAELHFVDTGKSDGGILDLFRAWQAADERRKICERTARGKDAKAQNGLVVSSMATPYGYTFADGNITPNKQASVVQMIYTWYVRGDDDGNKLSINGIAGRLSKMGITTPGELKRRGRRRKRGAGVWNTTTIYKILSNPTYCGEWRWGVTRKDNGTKSISPIEEVITIAVTPIVDHTLWQAAQERREYNRRMSKRNTKRNYLLRGMVRCCGYSMAGNYRHNIKYYQCNDRHTKRFERKADCRRYIRCDLLDPIVWNYVLDVATDPEIFRQLLVEAQQQELDALQPKRERLKVVEGLISQAETDAAKLAQALVNTSGGVVGDILKKQIDDVNTRHVTLCAERNTLTAEIEAGALSDNQIAAMLTMFNEDVITGLQNATFEDKRQAIEDLQIRVFIEGENARVTCRIPISDGVFALNPSQ